MKKRITMLLVGLVLSLGFALGQNVKMTGTVLEDNGEPCIGATVMIQGTKQGTKTDMDGKFTISVPVGKKITISYIGMISQTVKPQNGMTVRLVSDAHTVGEVVVTGMQKQDKRLFTGATTKIDAESTKLDGIADVSRALEGRAAGVSVQNVSGTFGTAPKIQVRGATSIYGNSSPLWVVDGVILSSAVNVSADDLSSGDAETLISNAIAGLNADDIESFQVLKDGSATSIYGARAMAGVVVITTKRGRGGRSTINYTGEFTYRLKPNYNEYNISNSQEQMGIYREMAAKGWLEFSTLANSSTSGLYGRLYTDMATYNPETDSYVLPYNDAAMNRYLQEAEFRNTDWFDLLFNNNIMQNHSVSISSGSDKASLYASLSVLNDPGWTKDASVERYTANMNASFKLSKNLEVMLLTNGSYRDQEAPGTLARSTDVVSGAVNRSFDINPFSYAMNTSRTLDPNQVYTRNYAPFNIFQELDNNYINAQVTDLKFQGEVTYKPILGLEIKALGAYRINKSVNEHFVLNNSNQAQVYRAGVNDPNIMYSNKYLYTNPDIPNALPMSVMPTGGIYIRNDYEVKQLDFRGTIQYNKVWNEEMHNFTAFAGMEANRSDYNQMLHSDYGVDYDAGRMVSITPEFYKQAKEEGTTLNSFSKAWDRRVAYFANVNYAFKGRYVLNLTGRYDGSNQLGKSRSARWLPTWNVSPAWNISEEPWFEKWSQRTNGAMSYAKLRLSYSLTGEFPSNLAYMASARPKFTASEPWKPQSNDYESGLAYSDYGNSELTYEKKYEYNVGVDLGFLQNRINLTADVYWRDNFDLLGYTNTQGGDGIIQKFANVADMKSNGFEATLSTKNIQTKDFKWNTDLTFSWVHTEITNLKSRSNVGSLVSGSVGFSAGVREGYPHRALFSIPFVGLNDEGIPQIINENGEKTTTDIYFQEYEKLDFLKYEGSLEPTITGGFGNIFSYKNWRMNIFITYSFGNKVRLDPVFSASYSDMSAMPKEFKNRWVEPGDENITDIPTIASVRQYKNNSQLSYAYNAYNYSTARVADGGFIRMKNISLTYDVPATFLSRIGLSTASLKLDGTNLFLIYADKKLNGQDPEFVNSGGVANPMAKQFTFTLRLGI